MENIKLYKDNLEKLLEIVNEYQEVDCIDVPKNRIIRFRNNNIMKLIRKEIEDISEGDFE